MPSGHDGYAMPTFSEVHRMKGLQNTLNYLLELLQEDIPLERANILFISHTASTIIDIADTNETFVMGSYHDDQNSLKPVVLMDKIKETTVVNDLLQYQTNENLFQDPFCQDLPFLMYKSLLRLPLLSNKNCTVVINFWSQQKNVFKDEARRQIEHVLIPLKKKFQAHISAITFQGSVPLPQTLSGQERLNLCPGLSQISRIVETVARCDSTVLLLGETGTGKEVIADAIHQLSHRNAAPFIKINCGSFPESLIDSMLFGHEKGSFTGATHTKPGYFEMADGGTLFLDEIGEMSPATQVRLLRVLDTGMIRRIGASHEFRIDVRIVAATHENLPQKVESGQFRQDLWYRLAVLPLRVPPLRERLEDIPVLVRHFVHNKAYKLGFDALPDISEEELQTLIQYKWKGNVRELEHTIERALIKYKIDNRNNEQLHFDLSPAIRIRKTVAPERRKEAESSAIPASVRHDGEWPTMKELQRRYVKEVIAHCHGKLTGAGSASSILDMHYTTLRSYIHEIGLPVEKRKKRV